MILLCISLFLLRKDAFPPVVYMDILNSSTSKFVISVESSNALSSSNLTRLHGCCSFISVVRMKRMLRTCALLDAVGNTHRIIVFVQTNMSLEVNPRVEVTFEFVFCDCRNSYGLIKTEICINTLLSSLLDR